MKQLLYIFPLFLLFSCNTTNSNSLPILNTEIPLANSFQAKDEYSLSDFTLNNNYSYWEIRMNYPNSGETNTPLQSYQEDENKKLTQAQQSRLKDVKSNAGFLDLCYPEKCPVYGVSLVDNTTIMLTTDDSLLAFFGLIDTEAELNIWLWANNYEGLSYQKVGNGYQVVANWNNLCGTRGKDLVYVDENGKITKLKGFSTHEYGSCR